MADSRAPGETSEEARTAEARAADPQAAGSSVTLALVSHTNVGKTTLARTLLRRDVGEVLDQAHVTEEAEVFTVIEADGLALRLADTPGFGDSARLLRRLRTSEKPLLWFFQQRWDRVADRPFWSSQQAALAVREHADVVLYLVNATEHPEDAGYVDLELELLDWLAAPVVVLLNQTGDTSYRRRVGERLEEEWRRHTARFSSVRDVLELDAFCRCWVEEGALWRRVEGVLPGEKAEAMDVLCTAWERRNVKTFEEAVAALVDYIAATGADREAMAEKRPSREQKAAAMEALGQRLVARTEDLMSTLLTLHGLQGDVAAEIHQQIDAFAVSGGEALDAERGALLGGMLSGALGGLAADVMAGGLTFGGGVVAGAILGALGGAGLARGYQLVQGDKLPEVGWSVAFLERLVAQAILRYLAVAHFGRGRGEFTHQDAARPWREAVAEKLRVRREAWRELLKPVVSGKGTTRTAASRAIHPLLDETAREVMVEGYPDAAGLLGVEAGGPQAPVESGG
ncbi:MAG: DUF3482 domain-containing protein [Acidobacteriota bacterium]